MSSRFKKGLGLMAGVLLWLAGAFPDRGVILLTDLARAAASSPVRALLIAAGCAVIVWVLWDEVLDLLGMQTNKRFFEKCKDWLHGSFKYALLETELQKDTFIIVVEFQGRRYTIRKSKSKPVLFIGNRMRPDSRVNQLITQFDAWEQGKLTDRILIEFFRFDFNAVEVGVKDGFFEAEISKGVLLTKDFDAYKLIAGIAEIARATVLWEILVAQWVRENLPKDVVAQVLGIKTPELQAADAERSDSQ